MSSQLTPWAVYNYNAKRVVSKAVLQILDMKKVPNTAIPGGDERYRLVLSDGQHYIQGLLGLQNNDLVKSEELKVHSIVRVEDAVCNDIGNKRIVVIINCKVVGNPGAAIGSAVGIDTYKGPGPDSNPSGGLQPAFAPSSSNAASGAAAAMKPAQSGMKNAYGQAFAGPAAAMRPSGQYQYHPINQLNPYNKFWTIKARVTAKSDMRTFSNQKGEGKLFTVDLLDASGGEIRATMFNAAADKFFPLFEVNKVYTISRGDLNPANKKFSKLKADYELMLGESSEVNFVGDDKDIAQQSFNFTPLHSLKDLNVAPSSGPGASAPEVIVDVIGIVKLVKPRASITSKKQKEVAKREIFLVDDSLTEVEVTLWGDQADRYNEKELGGNPVFAVKACRLSSFNGLSLSTTFASQLFVNPDHVAAGRLRGWYDKDGASSTFESLSSAARTGPGGSGGRDQRGSLADVDEENLKQTNGVAYVTVRGTVAMLRNDKERNPWYLACPSCKKKINRDEAQQTWACIHCNKNFPDPQPRYTFSFQCADNQASKWVQVFDVTGDTIMGITAPELMNLINNSPAEVDRVYYDAQLKIYEFRISAKPETNQSDGSVGVRYRIVNVKPITFANECRVMLNEISAY